jgi:CO/xanthine dehydrogenase Mo-binding subunit
MRGDAPLLDERRRTKSMAGSGDRPSNIATHMQLAHGDVEAGFAAAEVVLEREFTTQMVHQGYIETQNATAQWEPDGRLTVWTSTQGAFSVRSQLAELLQLPLAQVKVVPMEIGGGFGAKIQVYLDPLAAILSRKSGRPVKMAMSRTEVFEATGPTSGAYVRLKLGATREGKLIAAEGFLAFEAGALPGSPINGALGTMFGPYDIAAFRLDGYDVVVNKPRVSAYRAPGAPISAFACETMLDELAEQLGLDPIELRLRNAAKEGTRQPRGPINRRIGNIECLEAARASEHYRAPQWQEETEDGGVPARAGRRTEADGPPSAVRRGRGVANSFWYNNGGLSSLHAAVNGDGTVSLVEGSTDIGGTRATIAMQLAETLGIPYESVKPSVADTDSVGHNGTTGGSRVTFATGLAAYECALDIRRQLVARAARIWEVAEAEIEYEQGELRWAPKGAAGGEAAGAERRMSFQELAAKLNATGAPVVGRAAVAPKGVGPSFSVHIVDVEVDLETGKTDILRYTAVTDVGTAVHPSYAEGQIQGGIAQGAGWALNEEYVFDEQGRMLNPSFLDYRMPTALDLPMIETILVEVPNPGHPYGVRGVGEIGIVAPQAALANALYRATGTRFRDLPMNPGRILKETLGVA